MIMIPKAWENNPQINKKLKAFYEYFAPMVEPWDGPVSMVFADKNFIGATVDRNGLRPLRYYQTVDKILVVASEAGPFADSKIPKQRKIRSWRNPSNRQANTTTFTNRGYSPNV